MTPELLQVRNQLSTKIQASSLSVLLQPRDDHVDHVIIKVASFYLYVYIYMDKHAYFKLLRISFANLAPGFI